jgi:hypothetical protein
VAVDVVVGNASPFGLQGIYRELSILLPGPGRFRPKSWRGAKGLRINSLLSEAGNIAPAITEIPGA